MGRRPGLEVSKEKEGRRQASRGRVVCVDLDGTLLRTDLLAECAACLVRSEPWRLLELVGWLFRGRAELKRRLAECDLDVASLPYNEELLAWLREQEAGGAYLVLATAA